MNTRVALFRCITSNFVTIREYKESDWFAKDYVRLTEWVDVQFQPISELSKVEELAKIDVRLNGLEKIHKENLTTLTQARDALTKDLQI